MKTKNLPLIDLLLELPYVDFVSRDKDGNTPRSLAAGQGVMFVENLMASGTLTSIESKTTLQIASKHWFPFSYLQKVYLYQGQPLAESRLFVAIDRGDSASVASILNGFAEYPHMVNSNGDGPLNLAAQNGDEKIIVLLLNMESSDRALRFRGSDGLTPLESALAGGSSGIQKLLLYNRDAVYNAVKAQQSEFLRKILDVEVGLADDGWLHFRMPPRSATQAEHMSLTSHLLDMAADIRTRACATQDRTPFWIAAPRNHLDAFRLLVDRVTDLDNLANDSSIQNAAHGAYQTFNFTTTVEYDLEDNVEVNFTVNGSSSSSLEDSSGSKNLPWAAACGVKPEDVRALAKGVDVEVSGPWWFSPRYEKSDAGSGHTWAKPIWVAASLGYTDIVSLLIQYGADIEARDTHYGMTPFLIASHQNKPEVMMVLIEGGADIQAKPLW